MCPLLVFLSFFQDSAAAATWGCGVWSLLSLSSHGHGQEVVVHSATVMPNLRATKLYTSEQIRNSPSRGDGVSEALENDYRRKTCLFIKAAGKELEL